MGLDTTHDCWHGAYSSFNEFRRKIAEQININLGEYAGYNGTKSLSDIEHNIQPLLNHSDCDGELTVDEAKSIVNGINSILENLSGDALNDDWFKRKLITFRDGCLDAITKNEIIEFH